MQNALKNNNLQFINKKINWLPYRINILKNCFQLIKINKGDIKINSDLK